MKKIGKYEIIDKLGEGAMGVVYKAQDPFMERVVAVKTIAADLDADPELHARFFREARSAGQLSHKNIITIYELGEDNGRVYMAMEFLDGEDLKDKIALRRQLQLEEKLRMMVQLCEGLSHAHHEGIIHRDIKPGNIHITRSGQTKILDFGLARIATSDITKIGSVMGTPSYMSPEQVRGDTVDNRSDIFSVGAVFYEFLTNRKPFAGSSLPEIFFKILQKDPKPLNSIVSGIPEELCDIVRRAMFKEPERRYQQADELTRALEHFRPILEERKDTLLGEVREAVSRLSEFIEGNKKLQEDLESTERANLTMPVRLAWSSLSADQDVTQPGYADLGYLELLEARKQAEREQRWLADHLEKLQRAASLLDEAVLLEKQGQLKRALKVVEKILREMPDHSQAGPLAERIRKSVEDQRAEEERQTRITALLEDARVHDRLGDEEHALGQLGALLALEPQHQAALELKTKLETRREARERAAREQQRRVTANFEKAETAERAGDLERAKKAARSVLKDEPGHSEGRQLLVRIEAALAARKKRDEIERTARRLVEQAKELVAREEYRAAIALLEKAEPAVGRESSIQHVLEDCHAAARAQEEARERIAEHLQRGKEAFERGKYQASEQEMSRVLALDPDHKEAADYLSRAQRQIEAQREQKRRTHQLTEARAARTVLAADSLDVAAREVQKALALEPTNPDAERLRSQGEQRQAKRQLTSAAGEPTIVLPRVLEPGVAVETPARPAAQPSAILGIPRAALVTGSLIIAGTSVVWLALTNLTGPNDPPNQPARIEQPPPTTPPAPLEQQLAGSGQEVADPPPVEQPGEPDLNIVLVGTGAVEQIDELLTRGNRALERSNFGEALAAFDAVLATEPQNQAALEGRGRAEVGLRILGQTPSR